LDVATRDGVGADCIRQIVEAVGFKEVEGEEEESSLP